MVCRTTYQAGCQNSAAASTNMSLGTRKIPHCNAVLLSGKKDILGPHAVHVAGQGHVNKACETVVLSVHICYRIDFK